MPLQSRGWTGKHPAHDVQLALVPARAGMNRDRQLYAFYDGRWR